MERQPRGDMVKDVFDSVMQLSLNMRGNCWPQQFGMHTAVLKVLCILCCMYLQWLNLTDMTCASAYRCKLAQRNIRMSAIQKHRQNWKKSVMENHHLQQAGRHVWTDVTGRC